MLDSSIDLEDSGTGANTSRCVERIGSLPYGGHHTLYSMWTPHTALWTPHTVLWTTHSPDYNPLYREQYMENWQLRKQPENISGGDTEQDNTPYHARITIKYSRHQNALF